MHNSPIKAEQPNIRMDKVTTEAHSYTWEWICSSYLPVLLVPWERWAMYKGQSKLMTNLQQEIIQYAHEDNLRLYVQQRHDLDENTLQKVTWGALGQSLSTLFYHKWATMVKIIHHWFLTNAKLHAQGWVPSLQCPKCQTYEETQQHIFQCHNQKPPR